MLRAATLLAPLEENPEEEEAWDPNWSKKAGSFIAFLNSHLHRKMREWVSMLSEEAVAEFWTKENGPHASKSPKACFFFLGFLKCTPGQQQRDIISPSTHIEPVSTGSEPEKVNPTKISPDTPEPVDNEALSTISTPRASIGGQGETTQDKPTSTGEPSIAFTPVAVQAQQEVDEHRSPGERPPSRANSAGRLLSTERTHTLPFRPGSSRLREPNPVSNRQHEWIRFSDWRKKFYQYTGSNGLQSDNGSDSISHDKHDDAHQQVANAAATERSFDSTYLATSQQRRRSVDAEWTEKQPDRLFAEALRAVQQPRLSDRAGTSSNGWIVKALKDIDRAERNKSGSPSQNPRDRTVDEAMRSYERDNAAKEAAQARADADDAGFRAAAGKALERLQRAQMKGKFCARG